MSIRYWPVLLKSYFYRHLLYKCRVKLKIFFFKIIKSENFFSNTRLPRIWNKYIWKKNINCGHPFPMLVLKGFVCGDYLIEVIIMHSLSFYQSSVFLPCSEIWDCSSMHFFTNIFTYSLRTWVFSIMFDNELHLVFFWRMCRIYCNTKLHF